MDKHIMIRLCMEHTVKMNTLKLHKSRDQHKKYNVEQNITLSLKSMMQKDARVEYLVYKA